MELGDDTGRDDARLIRNVLLGHFAKLSLGEGKRLAGTMRMYLRFLASKRDCPLGLTAAVPTAPGWHLSGLRHHPTAKGEEEELPEREVGAEPRALTRHERREAMGRLRGLCHMADVLTDVRFINGVNEKETARETAELRMAIHQF